MLAAVGLALANRLSAIGRRISPRRPVAARLRTATIRTLGILAFGVVASLAMPVAAQAACTVTTASTSGDTITFAGTGAANTVSLCVNADKVAWGLFGATNGANPNVDAYNNFPLTAGGLSYTPLSYTTSKATYTLTPVGGDPSGVPQYDIVLNSATGPGADTITLWYASQCSHLTAGCGPTGVDIEFTDTTFTITVNLPGPPPPTVTSISPASGPAAGGTSVTITGTGFNGTTGASSVKFGATNAASYSVDSDTQITATAPAGTGTVHVTVTNNSQTSTTSPADQFTYAPAPTVTGASPNAGPTAGGTTVAITGTGFTGATAVTFGGTAGDGLHGQQRHPDHRDRPGPPRRHRQHRGDHGGRHRHRQQPLHLCRRADRDRGLAEHGLDRRRHYRDDHRHRLHRGHRRHLRRHRRRRAFTVDSRHPDHRDRSGPRSPAPSASR